MPLKTTVIGAWPKPSYLNLPDWFNVGMEVYSPESLSDKLEGEKKLGELVDRAVKDVLEKQIALGLDVVTDGEMPRECYYLHLCRTLKGIDMNNLQEKSMREGACKTVAPTIVGALSCPDPGWAAKEWMRTRDMARAIDENVEVKYTLPGPMTIVDGLKDDFYGEERRRELSQDLVRCINKEILLLSEAGCSYIQLDEPVMMRYPDRAVKYGVTDVQACFQGLPSGVTSIVHLCCGYPLFLDQDDYLKADKERYKTLAPLLDQIGVKQVSLENAEALNDLPSLLPLFKNVTVILGSVTVARSAVETKDDIRERTREALEHIDAERLVLAPDCGLGYLSEEVIRAKLGNMVAAAREI